MSMSVTVSRITPLPLACGAPPPARACPPPPPSTRACRTRDAGRLARAMPPAYRSLLDLIGRTPVARLQKLGRELGPTLLVKLEYLNPGGSNKDRIALRMLQDAEERGLLAPGGTII